MSGPWQMLRTDLPACRILPAVDGEHDERLAVQTEVDGVGEAREHGAPDFAMHTRKSPRTDGDAVQKGINSFGELPTESSPSRFVPCAYRKRLAFGLWPEYDSQRHASAQQFGANVSPGNRGLRVFDVFRPPTVELGALRLA